MEDKNYRVLVQGLTKNFDSLHDILPWKCETIEDAAYFIYDDYNLKHDGEMIKIKKVHKFNGAFNEVFIDTNTGEYIYMFDIKPYVEPVSEVNVDE